MCVCVYTCNYAWYVWAWLCVCVCACVYLYISISISICLNPNTCIHTYIYLLLCAGVLLLLSLRGTCVGLIRRPMAPAHRPHSFLCMLDIDREDTSSMITAGAKLTPRRGTVTEQSRIWGIRMLCSHSHGESIDIYVIYIVCCLQCAGLLFFLLARGPCVGLVRRSVASFDRPDSLPASRLHHRPRGSNETLPAVGGMLPSLPAVETLHAVATPRDPFRLVQQYIYIYIYICIYIHTYIYIYIYIYICKCAYVYTCLYACVCVHICVCMCLYVSVRVFVCVRLGLCMCMCMCVCVCFVLIHAREKSHTHIHTRFCSCVYVHTYTIYRFAVSSWLANTIRTLRFVLF